MVKIAVLGGGHGALTIAADMTLYGHRVTLFEMKEYFHQIKEIAETKKIKISGFARQGTANLHKVTSDIKDAIKDVDIILIVVPSFVHKKYAEMLAPCLKDGDNIVLIPGTFGSLEFNAVLKKNGCNKKVTISETDTLPYATRRKGTVEVNVFHNLKFILVGTFPSKETDKVFSIMQKLYPSKKAKNVIEVGLSNVNPTLHPIGVLMNVGRIEYSKGNFYYYEEGFTHSVASAIEAVDEERIALGKALGLSLTVLADSLNDVGYGPKGTLWETINGSAGLTPIIGPVVVTNRYLTEDVPIGLTMWSSLGRLMKVNTPVIDGVISICSTFLPKEYFKVTRDVKSCGIDKMSKKEIIDFVTNGNKK